MPKSPLIEEPSVAPEVPPAPRRELPWPQRRDQWRAELTARPPAGVGPDELEAHFVGMPARYWEQVTEADLHWGLEIVHRFLSDVAAAHTPSTRPVIEWRPLPGSEGTRVLLCTWDRRGLLAKAAACFSAVHLSIQQAEIFTRLDHVVLDVFRVSDPDGPGAALQTKLEQMSFLLDGALSEPPRFASVWACSRHKFLAPTPRLQPRITFDNQASSSVTLVRIEASDRLGLLYDVLQTLTDTGLNITQAGIETDGEVARDVLQVTDADGRKVVEPARLEALRQAIQSAVTV